MLPFVLPDGREVIVVMHHDLPEVLERLFQSGGRPPEGTVERLLQKYIDEHLGPVDPWKKFDDEVGEGEDDDWPVTRRPMVHDLVREILDSRGRREHRRRKARCRPKKYPRCPRCQACPCARGVPHELVPVYLIGTSAECPTCRAKREERPAAAAAAGCEASPAAPSAERIANPSKPESATSRNEPFAGNAPSAAPRPESRTEPSVERIADPSQPEDATDPTKAPARFWHGLPTVPARSTARSPAAPAASLTEREQARRPSVGEWDRVGRPCRTEPSVERIANPSKAESATDPTKAPAARGDPPP